MIEAGTEEPAEAGRGVPVEMAEILQRIPHRYPFLLIDRAEDYVPGKSIVGIKCVTMNEPFFPGHFPDNPVMPGVLLIEAIAQTGAVLMSKTLSADLEQKTIFFLTLDNCRFRQAVKPGDVLRMPVEVVRARADVFRFHGRAMVEDKVAAELDFAAMVVQQNA